jgi:hypothetical protein
VNADRGATLVDVLMTVSVMAVLAALSAPMIASAVDSGRARHAAGFVATRFRQARAHAAATTATTAVLFDREGDRWTFRICEDRNGNGLRRAEIDAGPDVCVDGPHDLSAQFPGVQIAVDATLRGPDGEPGSADPVRFGRGDIASFSPAGTCSAGSLLLRSRGAAQYMVRVAGVTGRARILKYDRAANVWRDG